MVGSSHPLDILRFAAVAGTAKQAVALVFVTRTVGGAVRAPGLRMAVRSDGVAAGYISNGCVEADIVTQALSALAEGRPRSIAYGEGAPHIDLRLPCGGRIELLIVTDHGATVIAAAIDRLVARRAITMQVTSSGSFALVEPDQPCAGDAVRFLAIPKIRVRIAGTGAEVVTLAKLALASDMDVDVHSPDAATARSVAAAGCGVRTLTGLSDTIDDWDADDCWTAWAVLFHDHEWEARLLPQILAGDAFYKGILGSYRTHLARREALLAAGLSAATVDRLRAPIGIVPRLRDAPLLAISVLAEIVQAFQETYGSF